MCKTFLTLPVAGHTAGNTLPNMNRHTMKTFLTTLKVLSVIGFSVAAGWYVFRTASATAAKPDPIADRPPLTVELVRTEKKSLSERIQLIGSVHARSTVQVRSRVDGYITSMPHSIGETVDENETLIQLDESRNRELVAEAEAAFHVAQAQLEAKQAASDLAELEWQRMQRFRDSNIYTDQQRTQISTNRDISTAEVALAAAQVEAARAVWQSRKLELAELTIKSPMSGVLAERMAEAGDLAKSDLPLLTLVNIDEVRIIVNVSEVDYQLIRPGQKATIRLDAIPNQDFEGNVAVKAPVLDPATRTAVIEIAVMNPEHKLKPGMHARATVVCSSRRDAVTVPTASLVDRDGRRVVYVFDQVKGIVHERAVQTGLILTDVVEILQGIQEDTPVVRLGSRMIHDGQQVAVNWVDTSN